MTRLPLYLSLCFAVVAGPALAQTTITLDGGSSAGLSMNAPPNLSLQVEDDTSSDDTTMDLSVEDDTSSSSSASRLTQPPVLSMSVEDGDSSSMDDESSSSELSHMTEPPNFMSSEDDDEGDDETSEPSGPALSSHDALQLFTTLCSELGLGAEGAEDNATAAGWQLDEPVDTGPYVKIVSGYQEFAGYGSVDFWSSLQTFPTQRLGYCRISFGDADNLIDFTDLNDLGFTGETQDNGDGNVFGAWDAANHTILLSGDRADGEAQLEFNVITPVPEN
jgi:hypothetical protein